MMISLKCIVCGREYEPRDRLTCDACGPADGVLDVAYDYDVAARTMTREALASRPLNHWRYRELLPVNPDAALPPLEVGWTPVYDGPRLARHIGVARMRIKDDGRNPTASFKDRASSVGVAKALEFGHAAIACASTGNAASSLAGMAASVGLRSCIFVPQRAPEPKVAQLLLFGATVLRVRGTYDQAYDLCMQAASKYGWYNRNCAVNSYLVEGKKTAGLEIAEQVGVDIPDWVAVSVGDGCTIAGVWKGLDEMHRLGFIPRLPRLLAVQAEGSDAVARQFEAGEIHVLEQRPTASPRAPPCASCAEPPRKSSRRRLRARERRRNTGGFAHASAADRRVRRTRGRCGSGRSEAGARAGDCWSERERVGGGDRQWPEGHSNRGQRGGGAVRYRA